ncbi:hypothetical protein Asulf_01238 [Archaeoglobus sulfaticallidus PM70-1]|uniref:DUF917 domain-containing protein n=1 Tax=Archaeoglobus sulfaticallidus PM70-1 TaxID=387631 RepID=N0BC89_9EURY|nr:DUF917 domain-containing protein [Archaeoglobus sulfaticallidus]AGK61234.1 hypothetical protein Asulf_01238 [Archaeoglobus sulfaticallidus PM70-1]
MRELSEIELRDIIEGCTVLGTGGGGDPKEGWEMIEKELKSGKKFMLAGLDEVPDDGIVAMPYFVGSVSGKKVESVYEEGEGARSYRLLEEYMGKEFWGVISTELGGANTAVALVTAAKLGLPIVDGDPAGRSVPELQHTTYYILGIGMTPFSVVTPLGDEIVISKVKDDFQAEKIVRGIVASIGTDVGVTSHPIPGKLLRDSVIKGAISYALKIGEALRAAREEGEDPIKALIGAGNGFLLFKGIASKSSWKDEGGFTIGEFELNGTGEFEGETYRVWFKNENLISWRNGEVDVTIPDLICVLTPDGHPVTNPNVQEGEEYAIVGLPAPQLWRTPKGLEIFGPKSLGLEIEYTPIEAKYGK